MPAKPTASMRSLCQDAVGCVVYDEPPALVYPFRANTINLAAGQHAQKRTIAIHQEIACD